jgi:hypothetical protein
VGRRERVNGGVVLRDVILGGVEILEDVVKMGLCCLCVCVCVCDYCKTEKV